MTDELEPEQPSEPEQSPDEFAAEGFAAEGFGDEIASSAYPGESIVHRITHPDPLGELKDAAKWGYHKLIPEKPDEPEPGGIVIDLPPSEEETTMRSTWVEHDDPPPPAPEPPAGHGR